MKLIPIQKELSDNAAFTSNPLCQDSIYMTLDFYKKAGFKPPWIAYYAMENNELVGCCAFKGEPVNGVVEIAYGTFENARNKGIATKMCRLLVELSLHTDPSVKITARTLPEKNFSTRVLFKNGFTHQGMVIDPEDGEVWEWLYIK
jgi:RimJ/RimL family protein N-acetyltransferase